MIGKQLFFPSLPWSWQERWNADRERSKPPFRPTAGLGDGLDKCAGFPIIPARSLHRSAGAGERPTLITPHSSRAIPAGESPPPPQRRRRLFGLGMRKEMAEIKAARLAFGKSRKAEGSPPRHLLLLFGCWGCPRGRNQPSFGVLAGEVRWRCGVFPPRPRRYGGGLQPQIAPGGRGRLRNDTFWVLSHQPLAVTHLAGHPLSMVAMGPRRCNPGKGDSQSSAGWRRAASLDRRTDSAPHLAAQNNLQMAFQPHAVVTEAPLPPWRCATRCYCLVGG